MIELNHSTLSVVRSGACMLLFYTDWCPLCPGLAETLANIERTQRLPVAFAKINFDQNREAVQLFGVVGVPTVVMLRHGLAAETITGLHPEEDYQKAAGIGIRYR